MQDESKHITEFGGSLVWHLSCVQYLHGEASSAIYPLLEWRNEPQSKVGSCKAIQVLPFPRTPTGVVVWKAYFPCPVYDTKRNIELHT
jgi:hypothetical protein